MPIKLVLVDDHPVVLQGLKGLFSNRQEFDVIECCASGAEAVEAVRAGEPDVVVLDLKMPKFNGLDVLRALAANQSKCRTVLLTAALDDADAVEAVRLGAYGIVLKDTEPETLVECVRRVSRDEKWLDRDEIVDALTRGLRRQSVEGAGSGMFTRRELEIVRMVAEGLRNKVIAERLGVTEGTVKIHLHNIFEKVGVESRLELVLYAQTTGLI